MNFQEWQTKLGFEPGDMSWIGQVFMIVFLILLLDFLQKRILSRLQSRLEHTRNHWDDALLDSVRKPLSLLIWIVGLIFAIEVITRHTEAALLEALDPLRIVAVIVCLTWFLVRFIKAMEVNLIEGDSTRDATTVSAIAKLLRISVIITAALVILQSLGFSISGVLAFGGIGGLAVGLAAKDLLANFFGGLMIHLDRPFSIGDWVRSPDREIEGTVEEIGWRLTKIRTFDKRPLYVPNATFTTITVENPSRMSHRRIYETIGIRYADGDKMHAIVHEVKAMLLQHPDIDTTQTLMVNFNTFAASSLDFFVYTFTKTTVWQEYHEVKQDVLLRIQDIIAAHGAEIAFPTSTIHLASESPAAVAG